MTLVDEVQNIAIAGDLALVTVFGSAFSSMSSRRRLFEVEMFSILFDAPVLCPMGITYSRRSLRLTFLR